MNVLEILNKELEGKDWSLQEKIRYLYIRSCELFSYDERFNFYNIFAGYEKKQKEIRKRKIDLENVVDNRVICTSFSREVFSKLLKELLNIDSVVCGKEHAFVMFYDGKRKMKADATIFSDLSRVKMNLFTKGYKPSIRTDKFSLYLKNQDKRINYIDQEYANYYIDKTIEQVFNNDNNSDELVINKFQILKKIFDEYDCFKSFYDADFCISYLRHKLFGKGSGIAPKVSLFNVDDSDYWENISIYPIQLEKDVIYYILEKSDKKYSFYQIDRSDAINYADSMEGINKGLIYRRK